MLADSLCAREKTLKKFHNEQNYLSITLKEGKNMEKNLRKRKNQLFAEIVRLGASDAIAAVSINLAMQKKLEQNQTEIAISNATQKTAYGMKSST